jgi:hypothetical protein
MSLAHQSFFKIRQVGVKRLPKTRFLSRGELSIGIIEASVVFHGRDLEVRILVVS